MIVQLKSQHPSYPDLSEGRNYFVLGIEANDDRLLNDRGQPYLYDAGLFDIVESMEPADWINDVGEDGERYAYPAPLNAPGFFEDFFDQKPEQVSILADRESAARACGLKDQKDQEVGQGPS